MKIVISSGHGLKVRGASGIIDEVDEARRVVKQVVENLRLAGHTVTEFHDDTSTTQSENLNTIVNFHNKQGPHDLDVSVHFNAYTPTSSARGTECLYLTQAELAKKVSSTISVSGKLVDRGPKKRTDLKFLNATNAPAILIEVCFVDSQADVEAYETNFEAICAALGGASVEKPVAMAHWKGKVSHFGGPQDTGVSPSEGLAFIYNYDEAPHLFLDKQPPNTTGLAPNAKRSGFESARAVKTRVSIASPNSRNAANNHGKS